MVKLNKIKEAILKWGECFLITDESGRQWVGTMAALYSLEGMPEVTLQHLPAILDIDRDTWVEKVTTLSEFNGLPSIYEELLEKVEENSTALRTMEEVGAEYKNGQRRVVPMSVMDRDYALFRVYQMAPLPSKIALRYEGLYCNGRWYMAVMEGLFPVALMRETELPTRDAELIQALEMAARRVSKLAEDEEEEEE